MTLLIVLWMIKAPWWLYVLCVLEILVGLE